MKKAAAVFLCVMLPAAAVYAQTDTYVGWYNDGSRSVAGHGCLTSSTGTHPMPEMCGSGSNWAWSQAYLWVCAQEGGITRLQIQLSETGVDKAPECTPDLGGVENDLVLSSTQDGYMWGEHGVRYDFTFDGCRTGWFWVKRWEIFNEQQWCFIIDEWNDFPTTVYTCAEPGVPAPVIHLNFQYCIDFVLPDDWEGGDIIGVENRTWGAIKAIQAE